MVFIAVVLAAHCEAVLSGCTPFGDGPTLPVTAELMNCHTEPGVCGWHNKQPLNHNDTTPWRPG